MLNILGITLFFVRLIDCINARSEVYHYQPDKENIDFEEKISLNVQTTQ